MNKYLFFLILTLAVLFIKCKNDDNQMLIDQQLLGEWRIDSLKIGDKVCYNSDFDTLDYYDTIDYLLRVSSIIEIFYRPIDASGKYEIKSNNHILFRNITRTTRIFSPSQWFDTCNYYLQHENQYKLTESSLQLVNGENFTIFLNKN